MNALVAVLGTQLFAFALSFAVIAFYWLRNHQFFARLRHVTGTVVVANLVLMAFVVLLPFTTEALGDFAELPLPTAVYAMNIAATSGTEALIFCLAWRAGLLPRGPRRALLVQLVPQVVPPAVFLGSVPLAYLWSPSAARFAWLSIAVIAPVAGTWAGRRGGRE